jgi:hypothetical protein
VLTLEDTETGSVIERLSTSRICWQMIVTRSSALLSTVGKNPPEFVITAGWVAACPLVIVSV